MEVKASLKYLRISPRKTRLVAAMLKNLSVHQAEAQLAHNKQRSAEPIMKLLKSAVNNAENNFHLNKNNLFIKSIRVDEGPALKRSRMRARGAMYEIKKRTSHINIILGEIAVPSGAKIEKRVHILEPKIEAAKSTELKETKVKKSFKLQEEKITKRILPKQKIFRRKVV